MDRNGGGFGRIHPLPLEPGDQFHLNCNRRCRQIVRQILPGRWLIHPNLLWSYHARLTANYCQVTKRVCLAMPDRTGELVRPPFDDALLLTNAQRLAY